MRPRPALLALLALIAPLLYAGTPAAAAVPPPTGRSDLRSFQGLATWVDGFDFSRELTRRPTFTARTVQFAAANGVKTIYIQGAKRSPRTPYSLLSRDRLGAILLAAHARGIRVVAWYLPTFDKPSADFMHLDAMMQFKVKGQHFDGIGIDIESTKVPVATRNARLVALSKKVRARTWLPVSAIVLPPVLTEIINPSYWSPFPWTALKASYDVWIPMGYYTAYRRYPTWRDAGRSTAEDIRRLRRHLGPVPIHYAGGIGDASTRTDFQRFTAAARSAGAIGVSVYDYATTPQWAWSVLRAGAARPAGR